LIDLQNSFTTAKSRKFPTKLILGYPSHLKYVAALLGELKNQKFALCMHVKRLKCDFLSHMQQISVKCHENKCKDYKMQNNNILLFVRSLSLTSLIKALQLSKVRLSTIKHQHSKNLKRWTEAT